MTLCDPVDCSTPVFPIFQYLPEFAQIHAHWLGDDIQPSHPLMTPSSFSLQSLPASGSFPVGRLHIRWPKYWRFSISPSNEYSGLISFRIDCFNFLEGQGTLLFGVNGAKFTIGMKSGMVACVNPEPPPPPPHGRKTDDDMNVEEIRVFSGWDSNVALCSESKCSRWNVNKAQNSCGFHSLMSGMRKKSSQFYFPYWVQHSREPR